MPQSAQPLLPGPAHNVMPDREHFDDELDLMERGELVADRAHALQSDRQFLLSDDPAAVSEPLCASLDAQLRSSPAQPAPTSAS